MSLERHILIVEDNEVNSKVAKRMLSKLGYSFEHAVNGQEGIERLSKEAFHIVLMDLQMPVMDGLSATRWIFANQVQLICLPHIIALTANATAEDRQNCQSVGMVDFISKPIVLEDFAKTLDKWTAVPLLNFKKHG